MKLPNEYFKKNCFDTFKEWCKYKGLKPGRFDSLDLYMDTVPLYVNENHEFYSEDECPVRWSEYWGCYVPYDVFGDQIADNLMWEVE